MYRENSYTYMYFNLFNMSDFDIFKIFVGL